MNQSTAEQRTVVDQDAGNQRTGDLRHRVAELVDTVTGGAVPAAEALTDGASLVALGLDSLGMLRLIDAIELEFDVAIDLDPAGGRLDTVDDIVEHLVDHASS